MYGQGLIEDIINALMREHDVQDVSVLSAEIKLQALCEVLQISPDQFDALIAHNSPVLRTIQGHAFEICFDELMLSIGQDVIRVGGDGAIDRIVNGKDLQLKTPHKAGTKEDIVEFKTHKTHGPKSELESVEYLHSGAKFADLLVGLVSYYPLNILFLENNELPRHPKHEDRILSPFKVEWPNHPGLNAWGRIGVKATPSPDILKASESHEVLPKTSENIGVKSNLILNTILSMENFRIWDMSIRGFSRETVFSNQLSEKGILLTNPKETKRKRFEKVDLVLTETNGTHKFFQVKGVSLNKCRFDGMSSRMSIETQLTRGRINDDPTHSRMYLFSDFDFLIIGLDPPLTQKFNIEAGRPNANLCWRFFCIPSDSLEPHQNYSNRIKPMQRFRYDEMDKYEITNEWFSNWKLK